MEAVDRISQLPDDIISNILSRLPTDDATTTSILSRCWRYKWTSIYDLDLYDEYRDYHRTSTFVNFVFRLLFTCNSRIRSFSLSLSLDLDSDKYYEQELDPKYVETWISIVLARNVEILKICAENFPRLESSCFRNWTLLTELDLSMNCTLVFPVNNLLPNLRRLSLDGGDYGGIKIEQDQISSDDGMILIFPVLEYLFLKCDWLDVNFVEIHAPELITFDCFCLNELKDYVIKIFGPKLTTFRSKKGIINNYHLNVSPSVSYLELDHSLDAEIYGSCLVLRAHEILKCMPNLKCLSLSGDILLDLVPPNPELGFPTFGRLRELRLGKNCYIKDVMELLQLLPEVELLSIDVTSLDYNKDISWDPKIVSNLKTVELGEFSGHKPQLNFLQFILENAKKLQKMSVVVYSKAPENVKETIDYMSKLLRNPSSCVIEVL